MIPSPIRVANRYVIASVTLTFTGNVGAKSSKITSFGKKATAELERLLPEEAESLIQNKRSRDKGDNFHVTIMTPPEMKDVVNRLAASQGLSKSKASDAIKTEIESIGLSDSGLSCMHKLTASDRSALIKLASSLPAGSSERRAILAGLGRFEKDASKKLVPQAIDCDFP